MIINRFLGMLVIVTAGFFFFNDAALAEAEGRYQLFQGKYSHWNLDSNVATDVNECFLLDTVTGDVQVYVSTEKEGKRMKYWTSSVVDETAGLPVMGRMTTIQSNESVLES